MRLVATFDLEQEAFQISAFLKSKQIPCCYEQVSDPLKEGKQYQIWVVSEDDVAKASEWVDKFRSNPNDPVFVLREPVFPSPGEEDSSGGDEGIRPNIKPHSQSRMTLTNFLIALCVVLFFWNTNQVGEMVESQGVLIREVELTPMEQALFFDYPQSAQELEKLLTGTSLKDYKNIKDVPPNIKELFAKAERVPYWKGLADVLMHWKETGLEYLHVVPLFEKIRKGEIWRFFTPCLLHRDFLHILFNMAWLFVLGRQIEERLKKWKMALLILIIGVVSNTVQYLVGGPYFLGFSGVVVGMVGYIWMRQRKAPWEGYPLHRSVLTFVFVFVIAMLALELIASLLALFEVTEQSAHIANTAHLVGGLVGMYLGKRSYFSKGPS